MSLVLGEAEARREMIARLLPRNEEVGNTDALALDCALLRAVAWSLSEEGSRPVTTARLLNVAQRYDPAFPMGPTSAEAALSHRDRLRGVLDTLASVDDLSELPHGRWLPAPLRIVPPALPSSGSYLLVGGFPTAHLPLALHSHLSHEGAFRHLRSEEGVALSRQLRLPEQGFDAWCRLPRLPLARWTEALLAEPEFAPYAPLNGEVGGEWDIYAPAAAPPGCPQHRRWRSPGAQLAEGPWLARHHRGFGWPVLRLVKLVRGKISQVALPGLGPGDFRRLLYGLDILARNSVRPVWEQAAGNARLLTLTSPLPGPELRWLASRSRRQEGLDRYAERYLIAPSEAQEVLELLGRLGLDGPLRAKEEML